MTPAFIAAILESRVFAVVTRIVLTFVFWAAAIGKAVDFQDTLAEMSHFGLNPPAVFGWAVIATLLIASILIILNVAAWIGFGALGVFLVMTIPIAHPFWAHQGEQALHDFRTAVEHVSLLGGLMAGAILSRRR